MVKYKLMNIHFGPLNSFELDMDLYSMKDLIVPDFIERKAFDKDDLQELADNILQNGLINPLTVKANKDKYEIVAGHRRFKALKLLGVNYVKCVLVGSNKYSADVIKYSENIFRTDLTDLEEAESIQHLIKVGKVDEKKVAKQMGKSLSYVQSKLAILKWPERLREALQDNVITYSVARELVRIKNVELMHEYLRHAISGGVTPAMAKTWVDDILHEDKKQKGLVPIDSAGPATSDVQPARYFCFYCGQDATVMDSTLVRVHTGCQKAVMKGG